VCTSEVEDQIRAVVLGGGANGEAEA
jgi:hypothetical protein